MTIVPSAASKPANDAATEAPPVAATADNDTSERADAGAGERIAVLAMDGPLVIEVAITLAGRPHSVVFDELVKQVLVAADTDNDGRATWQELAANEKYLAGGQPNMPAIGSRQLKMLIERYDENRDGQIQRSETMSWLGRNSGASANAFSIRSNRSYSSNPLAGSRAWQMLDADRNGRLSKEELSAASSRFWSFDADDDRVIAPPELASLREQLAAANPQMTYTSQDTGRYAAIRLDSEMDVGRLEFLLSDLYSPRQSIGVTSLGSASTELFDSLDANSDGWLEQQELADLQTVSPHLKLSIAFASPAGSQQVTANITIASHSPQIAIVSQASEYVVLSFSGSRLIVSAHDVMPGAAAEAATGPDIDRSQIRVMVHDQYDALFGELDANADGRLGEREIDSCPQRLLARDTNGDGQLGADELSSTMIVAFLRGERANEQSFYIPATAARPANNEPASNWFLRADFNRDGDISRREFLGSFEQFAELDANGNGYIEAGEAAAFIAK